MAEKIEAMYEELETMAKSLRSNADQIDEMIKRIRDHVQTLHNTWEGKGAKTFFHEMESDIFPALTKLKNAFQEGETTTRDVAGVFEQAEEDASGHFTK